MGFPIIKIAPGPFRRIFVGMDPLDIFDLIGNL